MSCKIALLLKEHFRNIIDSYLPDQTTDVSLTFYPYETLEELQQIFLRIKADYDAFYVSGPIPRQAINLLGEASRDALISFAEIDVERIYQNLLLYLLNRQSGGTCDLSRIGLDVLSEGGSLEDLLQSGSFVKTVLAFEKRWSTLQSIEELDAEEQRIRQYYVSQYEKGQLDFIITYYYSVVQELSPLGVPCAYIYRGSEAFWNSIEDLEKNVLLRRLRFNQASVIHVNTQSERRHSREDYRLWKKRLMECLQRFKQVHLPQAILMPGEGDPEFYLDVTALRKLTDDLHKCPLLPFLQSELSFSGTIGYGIGATIYEARQNALNASFYTQNRQPAKAKSCLMDDAKRLSVLLSEKENMQDLPGISAEAISAAAERTHLSGSTLLRISGVMSTRGSNELTSYDLIDELGMSLRSANKTLARLERCHLAEICGKRRISGRGRPINIYRIDLSA